MRVASPRLVAGLIVYCAIFCVSLVLGWRWIVRGLSDIHHMSRWRARTVLALTAAVTTAFWSFAQAPISRLLRPLTDLLEDLL